MSLPRQKKLIYYYLKYKDDTLQIILEFYLTKPKKSTILSVIELYNSYGFYGSFNLEKDEK